MIVFTVFVLQHVCLCLLFIDLTIECYNAIYLCLYHLPGLIGGRTSNERGKTSVVPICLCARLSIYVCVCQGRVGIMTIIYTQTDTECVFWPCSARKAKHNKNNMMKI